MALLVQLEAQDADSSAAPAANLFVHCTAEDGALQLLLAEGDALWRATVTTAQKPAALACSGADFQRTLHAAFSVARDDTTAAATKQLFTYKWSRSSGSLTLMEPSASSSFAMKYASLPLARVRASEQPTLFTELFQSIVSESEQAAHAATQLRARLTALESLLRAKDALLDAALRAKQQVEDKLFSGFCAVLNAKKDEIQRLQHELAVAHVQLQAAATFSGDLEVKTTTKQKMKMKGLKGGPRARAKGAKRHRKVKSEDESSGESGSSGEAEASNGHDESTGDDNDGDLEVDNDAGGFNRASSGQQSQRDAVNAYSQLPSPMRSGSQVCTAADVLSGLDAIINDDVAAMDDAMRSPSRRSRRSRPEATGVRDTPAIKKRKSDNVPVKEEVEEEVAAGNRRSKKTPKPKAATPPVKKATSKPTCAVDSEEDDILDMLA